MGKAKDVLIFICEAISGQIAGEPSRDYSRNTGGIAHSYWQDKSWDNHWEQAVEQDKTLSHNINVKNESTNYYNLEVLLIVYLFTKDDGYVTSDEKKIITEYFSRKKNTLTDNELRGAIALQNITPSIENIIKYIDENNITKEEVEKALKLIKELKDRHRRYNDVYNDLLFNLM